MPRSHLPSPGSTVTAQVLTTVDGAAVPVPGPGRLTHLQFRRFAGCPVCNLHLRSFARRHAEIEAAGVGEVVMFHTPAGELARHTGDLPFAVVADPDKVLYREFGVESSPRALLDPRAWGTVVRALVIDLVAIARRRAPAPALRPHGGRLGLPADILLGPDGTVVATHAGTHASDQWTVDELLALTAGAPAPTPC